MAHDFYLAEPIIRGLQTQLQNQLQTAINTVNADVTDSYTILPPNQVYDHVPLLTTLSGQGFPAVAIEDMGSHFEDDLVSSVTGVHRLAVLAFLAKADPEQLSWQLRRYQQAIALAIQFDRSIGGTAWTTRFLGIEPGPILEPGDRSSPTFQHGYVSWVAIGIECPREEV